MRLLVIGLSAFLALSSRILLSSALSSVQPKALRHSRVPTAFLALQSASVSTDTGKVEKACPEPVPLSFPVSVQVPLLQLALAGGVTTFFADACVHPIDCIKTLQQSDLGVDLTFLQAISYLHETAGVGGFFKGLFTYACSDAVGGAIKFSVWEAWKKRWDETNIVWLGAALAFVASSVVIVPGELVKQQIQMSHFDGTGEAVRGIFQANGLAGFFNGYDAVVYRDVPHTILELCLYDIFKRCGSILPSSKGGASGLNPLLAAALTGAVAGTLTAPLDTIKTKVMVEGYDSFWECFASTIESSGWDGVWAGTLARVLWIVPFTTLYLPTYDYLHKQLLQRHQRHLME
jgi:solute carrier family 25 S-adenosylmethionine transporter 26